MEGRVRNARKATGCSECEVMEKVERKSYAVEFDTSPEITFSMFYAIGLNVLRLVHRSSSL
jgi:hypothetical protein